MDTLKAIFGTIVAVAVIFGALALFGVGFITLIAIGVVIMLIGTVVAIYLTIREEIRFEKEQGLDSPPDP